MFIVVSLADPYFPHPFVLFSKIENLTKFAASRPISPRDEAQFKTYMPTIYGFGLFIKIQGR